MKNEILNFYGKEKQVIKAIEEMSELTKVLCKIVLTGAFSKNELIEEMADVINMLDYLVLVFNIDKRELQLKMFEKDKRTIEMINDLR